MKVPKFRAKMLCRKDCWVEGFYMRMPAYTTCIAFDPKCEEYKHYMATYDPGDWGLPNMPTFIEIDPDTLEVIEEIDV